MRVLSLQVMAAPVLPVMALALEQKVTLPSGLEAGLHEALWEGGGDVYRLRFVAPGFMSGDDKLDAVAQDMDFLCHDVVMPRLAGLNEAPARVIISLADRAVPFGQYDPEVSQVFEAYRVENGTCIWEAF